MNTMYVLRWRLRARHPQYINRVRVAKDVVRQAVRKAPFVLSWSTGKDSTAMVHLVRSVAPEIPIMIQFDDCDWPTKRAYADRVTVAQRWDVHRVEPSFSVWERMRAGKIGQEPFCSLNHSLTKDAFLAPLAAKQAELRATGVFMGLRAEESKARRVHLRSRGPLYRIQSGEWRCCPLMWWSAEDVFAYHTEHGIEINPCYLHNRFLPPEQIRISWAVPTPTSLSHGDMEHFRHYYPEQFQRLRDEGVIG